MPDHVLDPMEFISVRVGSHIILVSNDGGDPHLNVEDHLRVRVEGGHKHHPLVVTGEGEQPTRYLHLDEDAFAARHDGGIL